MQPEVTYAVMAFNLWWRKLMQSRMHQSQRMSVSYKLTWESSTIRFLPDAAAILEPLHQLLIKERINMAVAKGTTGGFC